MEKLMKVLSGLALSLIPKQTENIGTAFKTFKSGEPWNVLEDRIAKINDFGNLIPGKLAHEKTGFRKQVTWQLKVEGLVSEIIALGN